MPHRAALRAVETANYAKRMQQKTHFEPPLETAISNTTLSTVDDFMEAFSDFDYPSLESGRKGCLTKRDGRLRRRTEKPCRSVQFSTVQVHLHEMILGDNPSVLMGPPLTICWLGSSHQKFPVDEFEKNRGPPKRRNQMIWNRQKREDLLFDSGYSRREIESASQAVYKANQQRMESTKDFQKKRSAFRKFLDVFKKPGEPKRIDYMHVTKL